MPEQELGHCTSKAHSRQMTCDPRRAPAPHLLAPRLSTGIAIAVIGELGQTMIEWLGCTSLIAKERNAMEHPSISAHITFLYTPDLARTARFYEETVGLPLKLDQGSCRIYRISPDSYLGFCQRDRAHDESRPQEGDRVIVTLISPDVDGWYDHLREQGVEFDKAPQFNAEYNIYHCFFRDPNGYLIEIQRFLHPF
jgi:catechol 2,3-dioxygenase-like lactoylglutathione lyase family enzyme